MSLADDLNDIAAVIHRYSTAMDSRHWELMDQVFTFDATADMGGHLYPRGREEIVATIRAAIECCSLTHHMNTNIEAQVNGQCAKVTSRFLAWHRGRGPTAETTYLTMGTYLDDFVHTPGGWRIRHRVERNPVELWDHMPSSGDAATFFADALAAFARVAKSA